MKLFIPTNCLLIAFSSARTNLVKQVFNAVAGSSRDTLRMLPSCGLTVGYFGTRESLDVEECVDEVDEEVKDVVTVEEEEEVFGLLDGIIAEVAAAACCTAAAFLLACFFLDFFFFVNLNPATSFCILLSCSIFNKRVC